MKEYINQIEKIISMNLETRGMDKIHLEKELENTAIDLNNSDTIVIVTGFCIKECNTGETDGPIGAISLANSLELLNKKVIILTDEYTKKLIESGIETLNLKTEIFTVSNENSKKLSIEIIKKYEPCHVIAIERPGRSKDGKSYSMRGEDITDYTPDTDYIFKIAKEKGIKTSAIGDGGNEIGMGKIADYVRKNVFKGEQICAEIDTDNLIVAGISNWGGHAISAILSIINGKMLMYDSVAETEILQNIVRAGAVDGCTKERVMTVDGLSFEKNISIFRNIREIAENALIFQKLQTAINT